MFRIIVRKYKNKRFLEDNTNVLVLIDQPARPGLVQCCGITGHYEADYNWILENSKAVTTEEAEQTIKKYGYDDIKDIKIVKKWTR